jgi:DNA-directed RNA polymerase specialized sigma24 family protein
VRAKGKGLAPEVSDTPGFRDPAQFDEFYRRYFLPLVRRATWKHRLEKEDARDVVQEAFLVALAKLDPQRNPKAWLIQVVDHLSANFQRKVARRAKLVSRWSATGVGLALSVAGRDASERYGEMSDADENDDY